MLIKIPEIAKELGVAESTVRRWCERGEGPGHVKIGHRRHYLFSPEDVHEWYRQIGHTAAIQPQK